jgi:thioredoxin 1
VLERGIIVAGVAVLAVVAALIVRTVAARRANRTLGQVLPEELRERFPDGGPGIVYFYGAHCGPCVQQSAILEDLSTREGISVVRVDATQEPELADAFGVMTVPVTVVVDEQRMVRAMNTGLRPREALLGQVREGLGAGV